MTDAQSKNNAALQNLLHEPALASRIQTARIGIWTDDTSNTNSGRLLVKALAEFVGRLWQNIDADGPCADQFLVSAKEAAASGMLTANYNKAWSPPYDYVVGIGCKLPPSSGKGLQIGASGWKVTAGNHATVDDNPIPVGPMAAASIAACEIFKSIFADTSINEKIMPLPENYEWDVWYGEVAAPPSELNLQLNEVSIFGVGAVTHSLLWILEHWPGQVTGKLKLIDHDKYDYSNAHRYIGMRLDDVTKSKAVQAAERLRKRYVKLDVQEYAVDMNSYFLNHNNDCKVGLAVAGLDSIESRRQLALKIPRRMVNMWTEQEYAGASRFGFDDNWPCVFCIHPDNTGTPHDETAQIAAETGLMPPRVRELLFTGEGLTQQDVNQISQKFASNGHSFLGKPLRTVRGELCATGKLRLPGATADTDVPFVFVSGLAGTGGFIELIRESMKIQSVPGSWQVSALKHPTQYNWSSRTKIANCYLCSNPLAINIAKQKYG